MLRTSLVTLALLTLFAAPAWAQTRIISGFPPGGGVDSLARIFSERLAEALGRPVVVETRTGAAGVISAQ